MHENSCFTGRALLVLVNNRHYKGSFPFIFHIIIMGNRVGKQAITWNYHCGIMDLMHL